jgi:hypothetical protein
MAVIHIRGMVVVLANATVDVIKSATPQGQGLFRVKVWGQPPFDETRFYDIQATNENVAAQQGIRRFVFEMEDPSTKRK